tara:strand:- start:271 stop:519 length:249 start_codon:yes stop_codon:yes gene_type:complete
MCAINGCANDTLEVCPECYNRAVEASAIYLKESRALRELLSLTAPNVYELPLPLQDVVLPVLGRSRNAKDFDLNELKRNLKG